jgi:uncharacterized protein (DUF2062 family)
VNDLDDGGPLLLLERLTRPPTVKVTPEEGTVDTELLVEEYAGGMLFGAVVGAVAAAFGARVCRIVATSGTWRKRGNQEPLQR